MLIESVAVIKSRRETESHEPCSGVWPMRSAECRINARRPIITLFSSGILARSPYHQTSCWWFMLIDCRRSTASAAPYSIAAPTKSGTTRDDAHEKQLLANHTSSNYKQPRPSFTLQALRASLLDSRYCSILGSCVYSSQAIDSHCGRTIHCNIGDLLGRALHYLLTMASTNLE